MEILTHLCAQSFVLAASVEAVVNDDSGFRTVYISTGADKYARVFLASASGVGTDTDPIEVIAATETALGANWALELLPTGFVRLHYLGATSGTVTFTVGHVEKLLGLPASSGVVLSGGRVDGDYYPSHCVFSIAFSDDTGYQRNPPKYALAATARGKVYGWSNALPGARRAGVWRMQPMDWATRNAYALANPTDPIAGTPLFGADRTGITAGVSDPGQVPPWGCLTQINNTLTQRCGVSWGNLQDLIAGVPGETYDDCQLTAQALDALDWTPSSPNFSARWDVRGVEFVIVQDGLTL